MLSELSDPVTFRSFGEIAGRVAQDATLRPQEVAGASTIFSRKVFDMGKMCLSENTAPQSPCSTLSF